jgi:archaeal type IV pilus assembly protein PilA
MNVWGHNERSWRKARKRAVSPIIATILLVAITVVLAAVLYVLISGLTHGPGSTPIGSAFAAGNPKSGTCVGGGTIAANGCVGGDFFETLTIEQSSVTFANVLFEVIVTSTGNAWTCPATGTACDFTVTSTTGASVATVNIAVNTGMVMPSTGFSTYTGVTSGSSLSSGIYDIELDLGTKGTTGLGLSFVAIGTGGYSGTTSAVALL